MKIKMKIKRRCTSLSCSEAWKCLLAFSSSSRTSMGTAAPGRGGGTHWAADEVFLPTATTPLSFCCSDKDWDEYDDDCIDLNTDVDPADEADTAPALNDDDVLCVCPEAEPTLVRFTAVKLVSAWADIVFVLELRAGPAAVRAGPAREEGEGEGDPDGDPDGDGEAPRGVITPKAARGRWFDFVDRFTFACVFDFLDFSFYFCFPLFSCNNHSGFSHIGRG